MPTFQIADPASAVPLTPSGEGAKLRVKGTVVFAVANTNAIPRTANVSILPGKPADAEVYSLAGASPSQPGFLSLDFAARETQTVTVNISAPLGAEARKGAFSLRVLREGETDNDVAESRPVSFDIPAAAPAAPPPAPKPFPWVALAIAAVVVVLVVGVGAWLISKPSGPKMIEVPNLKGHGFDEIGPVFSALNGQATPTINPVTIKDPTKCGTSIETQTPLNANNLYPVDTVFTFTFREGTRTGPLCHRFDPNIFRDIPHVRVQ